MSSICCNASRADLIIAGDTRDLWLFPVCGVGGGVVMERDGGSLNVAVECVCVCLFVCVFVCVCVCVCVHVCV